MKTKHIKMYLDIASTVAQSSYAVRSKVGCVIVKDDRILSIGYNGNLQGAKSNVLEDKIYYHEETNLGNTYPYEDKNGAYRLVTKPDTLHAECNAILKLARDGQPAKGADMFLTLSPCRVCSTFIITTGINKVYYREQYRDTSGIDVLKEYGVETELFNE